MNCARLDKEYAGELETHLACILQNSTYRDEDMPRSSLVWGAIMAYKTIQTIWRNPDHEVTTTTLDKLAKTLGVTPSDLYEYVPGED
jgi:DNA-binding Xre family transcriptional regulator